MICRHYLVTPNERKEVQPLNFSSRRFKYTLKEGKGKYYYTKELDGGISFVGQDFALIKTLDEQGYACNPLYLESFALIDGAYKMVYKAILRIVDMKFDLDKCIVESPCKPFTPYLCLEAAEDDEINILEKITARSKINLLLGEYEFYTSTNQYTVDFTKDYTNHANNYLWTDGGAMPADTCWRYYKLVERMGLDINGALVGYGRSYWVREKYTVPTGNPAPPGYKFINTVGANDVYARPVMIYHSDYTTVQVPIGANSESTFTWRFGGLSNNSKILTNAVKLEDVLDWYANECGLSLTSDFFQFNPEVAAVNNYVTNIRNQYTKLYLIQKTDVKKPNATQPATKGILRFDYLMESLQTLFDIRYQIVNEQKLKIEHISSYSKVQKIDATIIDNGKWVNGQRKYEYASSEMPKRQLYKAMEQNNVDFVGKPIEYYDNCTEKGNEEKNQCQNITTDITFVIDQPDKIADEGFVLVACEEYDGKLYLAQTTGVLTNNEMPNNVLAFAQLHQYFHTYRRIKKTGLLNGQPTTFDTEKPFKKCVDIKFPFKDITLFEPDQLVKGALGNGEVKQALYDIKSDMLSVSLLQTSYQALAPGEVVVKSIYLKIVKENQRAFNVPFPNPYGLPGPGLDGFLYDWVVYSYSDAAGTLPAYPNGFNIDYESKFYINTVLDITLDEIPVQISGHKTIVQVQQYGEYTDTNGDSFLKSFHLKSSSNYTII